MIKSIVLRRHGYWPPHIGTSRWYYTSGSTRPCLRPHDMERNTCHICAGFISVSLATGIDQYKMGWPNTRKDTKDWKRRRAERAAKKPLFNFDSRTDSIRKFEGHVYRTADCSADPLFRFGSFGWWSWLISIRLAIFGSGGLHYWDFSEGSTFLYIYSPVLRKVENFGGSLVSCVILCYILVSTITLIIAGREIESSWEECIMSREEKSYPKIKKIISRVIPILYAMLVVLSYRFIQMRR